MKFSEMVKILQEKEKEVCKVGFSKKGEMQTIVLKTIDFHIKIIYN